jgi:hypothetical protein
LKQLKENLRAAIAGGAAGNELAYARAGNVYVTGVPLV